MRQKYSCRKNKSLEEKYDKNEMKIIVVQKIGLQMKNMPKKRQNIVI